MDKGVCNVSVAPVRADKTDKAEIVTEMLYGESADILEVINNWTKIKMHYDGYEGWIDTKQITLVTDDFLTKRKTHLVTEPFQSRVMESGKMLLSMGSEVSFETVHAQRGATIRQSIVETAKEFLNVPYLWGGKSFFGVDCSGFTQLVLKVHDIKYPRDAYQQGEVGEPLSFIEEAQPGDLAFFENSEGRIIHVGFMLENKELNKHTHKLRFIRNILG